MVVYAEINNSDGLVVFVGEADFDEVPEFAVGHPTFCADITHVTPRPQVGWKLECGKFYPPVPPAPKPELVIVSLEAVNVQNGARSLVKGLNDVTIPKGAAVAAEVEVRVAGQLVPADLPFCRLPIKSIDGAITYAIVDIVSGRGRIEWTPEFTGRWQIREELINSELPPEAHMGFAGVDVFVY